MNIVQSLVGGICLGAAGLIIHVSKALAINSVDFETIVLYAFVYSVGARSLYLFAFNSVRPWLIACVLSLEVVFGVMLAICCLGETVSCVQFAGCATVIAVTIGLAKPNQRRDKTSFENRPSVASPSGSQVVLETVGSS